MLFRLKCRKLLFLYWNSIDICFEWAKIGLDLVVQLSKQSNVGNTPSDHSFSMFHYITCDPTWLCMRLSIATDAKMLLLHSNQRWHFPQYLMTLIVIYSVTLTMPTLVWDIAPHFSCHRWLCLAISPPILQRWNRTVVSFIDVWREKRKKSPCLFDAVELLDALQCIPGSSLIFSFPM